jgi:hypothetical protein
VISALNLSYGGCDHGLEESIQVEREEALMVLGIEPMSLNNLLDPWFVHRVYLDVDMRVKSKGVTCIHHIVILSR